MRVKNSNRTTALTGMFLSAAIASTVAVSTVFAVAINNKENTPPITTTTSVLANQVGFLPQQYKVAIVPNTAKGAFWLTDTVSGKVVFQGELSAAKTWLEAGESVKTADFSSLSLPGQYIFSTEDANFSSNIVIANDLYLAPLKHAIRYYYLNRSSAVLDERYAGKFMRSAGHPDTIIYVDSSAASTTRPSGTVISAPKGWYDAGDYGKYIVNSNITVYTLLKTFENHPALFSQLKLNIPESDNSVPDLLDEILWNLDWMEAMQDLDGGVYHKLTTQNFSGAVMPVNSTAPRFVVQKSTAATLGFAATMAKASQIVANYEKQLPGRAARFREQALRAWEWALAHPDTVFIQPKDFHTGMYGTQAAHLTDEWSWAAAELFTLTHEQHYLNKFAIPDLIEQPSWGNPGFMALINLCHNPSTPAKVKSEILKQLTSTAKAWVLKSQQTGYGVAMGTNDFQWGSNSIAASKALALYEINRLSPNPEYIKAAQAILDYLLGRNPQGISYVTGLGQISAQNPHHRISYADQIAEPMPGMLVGGPHSGQQDIKECTNDGILYKTSLPAKSYLDHWCSYASNEVAINWNANLVYLLAEMNK